MPSALYCGHGLVPLSLGGVGRGLEGGGGGQNTLGEFGIMEYNNI